MYSPAEVKLFEALGLSGHLQYDPGMAYRLACEAAFLSGYQSPVIDTLRKGARAVLLTQSPPRLTPAFDELITLP